MAKETEQAKLLRAAKEKLGVTSEELADLLGVSYFTLRNWLAQEQHGIYREMPRTAKLLLAYVLADKKHSKKK